MAGWKRRNDTENTGRKTEEDVKVEKDTKRQGDREEERGRQKHFTNTDTEHVLGGLVKVCTSNVT